MVEITDNFLLEEDHKRIEKVMGSKEFPWYHHIVQLDKTNHPSPIIGMDKSLELQSYFTHSFLQHSEDYDYEWSNWGDIARLILVKLEAERVERVRGVISMKRAEHEIDGWHVDQEDLPGMRVGIYYLNTCNGCTILEDGTVVDSVANRMVTFPVDMLHTLVTHTDTESRTVINFNFWGNS